MKETIRQKLFELGFKIDFWYKNGKIDAICIAKRIGKDLVFQKEYREEDIVALILDSFLKDSPLNTKNKNI